jgi:adenylyltransferase/sulfurtransferase
MLNIDVWNNTFTQLKVARAREKGDCPCCKHHRFEFLEGKAGSSATTLCGRDAVQLTHKQSSSKLNFDEIAKRLRQHGSVSANEFMLQAEIRDNDKTYDITLFADGRAIVKGTGEANVARSLYAKYVGN